MLRYRIMRDEIFNLNVARILQKVFKAMLLELVKASPCLIKKNQH